MSRSGFRSTALLLGAGIALVEAYMHLYRPWQARWGATDAEVARAMPGDEMVARPDTNTTRAITIRARPEHIWPWICQIGFQRAGWYGLDLIDNLGRPSAREILPEFQNPRIGDHILMSAVTWEIVTDFRENEYMLWRGDGKGGNTGTWVWGLYPIDGEHTRLVVRMRGIWSWWPPHIPLFLAIVDAGDIVMLRACMLGIKVRAEALARGELQGKVASVS